MGQAAIAAHNVLYQPNHKRGQRGMTDGKDYWLLPEDLAQVRVEITTELLEYLEKWNYPDTVKSLSKHLANAQKQGKKNPVLKTRVLGIDNDLQGTFKGQPQSVANEETRLWLGHQWFMGRAFGGVHPNSDCNLPARFCALEIADPKQLSVLPGQIQE